MEWCDNYYPLLDTSKVRSTRAETVNRCLRSAFQASLSCLIMKRTSAFPSPPRTPGRVALSSPIGQRLMLTSMSKAQPCHLAASTATCAASGETTIADDQTLPVQHDTMSSSFPNPFATELPRRAAAGS